MLYSRVELIKWFITHTTKTVTELAEYDTTTLQEMYSVLTSEED